jgi:hypothetical protein
MSFEIKVRNDAMTYEKWTTVLNDLCVKQFSIPSEYRGGSKT